VETVPVCIISGGGGGICEFGTKGSCEFNIIEFIKNSSMKPFFNVIPLQRTRDIGDIPLVKIKG
jgi:hypothetical protein